jgi:hypothetical protein
LGGQASPRKPVRRPGLNGPAIQFERSRAEKEIPVNRKETSMTDSIADTAKLDGKKGAVDKYRTQWVAQFLVAAELTRRGYIVAFTLGNSPVFDMMVRAPSTNESFLVDVKGFANNKVGFFMSRKEQCPELYYIFVYASKDRKLNEDRFYLLTHEDVNALLDDDEKKYPNNKVPGLGYQQLERFKDHWDTLPKPGL